MLSQDFLTLALVTIFLSSVKWILRKLDQQLCEIILNLEFGSERDLMLIKDFIRTVNNDCQLVQLSVIV